MRITIERPEGFLHHHTCLRRKLSSVDDLAAMLPREIELDLAGSKATYTERVDGRRGWRELQYERALDRQPPYWPEARLDSLSLRGTAYGAPFSLTLRHTAAAIHAEIDASATAANTIAIAVREAYEDRPGMAGFLRALRASMPWRRA